MNDFKCKDCGTEYRCHPHIARRHPSLARCPKCKSGNKTRTEESKKMMQDIYYHQNQSLKRRGQ